MNMKCPNCGAEVTGKVCEYCGTTINRKAVCPECGSQHIRFDRGYQGTLRIPIGVCRDCGCEWDLRECVTPEIQTKFILLFFGFIFCFPVPVTYLIWKSEKFTDKVKYILIGVLWAAYFGIFIFPFIAPFFMFWF